MSVSVVGVSPVSKEVDSLSYWEFAMALARSSMPLTWQAVERSGLGKARQWAAEGLERCGSAAIVEAAETAMEAASLDDQGTVYRIFGGRGRWALAFDVCFASYRTGEDVS